MSTLIIEARFCGPPESGNGGYCCGLVARALRGPAEVRLLAPPPLGVALELEQRGDQVVLRHGATDIAQARLAVLALDPPPAPSFAAAQRAALGYAGFDAHNFPSCFVCGPERAEGDGLRLFPGPLEGTSLVAAPWQPDASLADEDGRVRNEFVWAALDCPSYYGLQRPGLLALLGTMHAHTLERPRAGSRCVVTGWRVGQDGRKYHAGSALCDEHGRVLAKATTVWIELKRRSTFRRRGR